MNEEKMIAIAKECGFAAAAFMDVKDLVIVPEYRKYCEMNLCHCYDVNPYCPPASGTVEEMTERVNAHARVLVLQTEVDNDKMLNPETGKDAKVAHNRMGDVLLERLVEECGIRPGDILRMSAGPWSQSSCMSAYCVDAQKMADAVGMLCWAKDGKSRFFSQILF